MLPPRALGENRGAGRAASHLARPRGNGRGAGGGGDTGGLPLIEYADGSDLEAPVIVVAGKERGPVAWLISCGHGDEFGGALAIARVAKALDPARMNGLVILIPVANPPAFQAMRRVNPSPDDLMDFGDAFPGRPRFATERIAEKYTALWKEHADFVVDLHTGGDRFVHHHRHGAGRADGIPRSDVRCTNALARPG